MNPLPTRARPAAPPLPHRRLIFRDFPLEAAAWIGGLMVLTFMDAVWPDAPGFCLLERVGIPFCPGCGLGRSVAHLLHGSVAASLEAHPLGIPALLLLAGRSLHLLAGWVRTSSGIHTPHGKARPWQTSCS